MERVKVGLYYDFASSLCYAAHRVITRITPQLEESAVELLWKPIDLTHMVPWDRGDLFPEAIRRSVEATAQSLGVELRMPPAWLDSRPSSAVALVLGHSPEEARWRDAVFGWIFGKKDPATAPKIEELARDLNLEWAPRAAIQLVPVSEATLEAAALGVEGVPTFLLDDWPVGGIHDDETMLSMLVTFAERSRSRSAEEQPN